MRRTGTPSEIRRLTAPVARIIDAAWQRMHWWVAAMAILYVLSGITIVKSDEVAVILRWGQLVGDTPALQEHGAGLLFAFPRPVDQVVRVQTKHVSEVRVSTLDTYDVSPDSDDGARIRGESNSRPAYAGLRAYRRRQYRARRDGRPLPGERTLPNGRFTGPRPRTRSASRSRRRWFGRWVRWASIECSDGRKTLIATATRRAQAGLDAAHSGLELSSLELTRLAPPQILASDFDAVQSAFIAAQTKQNEAQGYAQGAIPQAQAEADSGVQTAKGAADSDLATAKGDADAFSGPQ